MAVSKLGGSQFWKLWTIQSCAAIILFLELTNSTAIMHYTLNTSLTLQCQRGSVQVGHTRAVDIIELAKTVWVVTSTVAVTVIQRGAWVSKFVVHIGNTGPVRYTSSSQARR
jgi:hypothetical protein